MFIFSKILGWLIEPANLIVALTAIGLLARALGRRWIGGAALGLAGAGLLVGIATPLGETLLYRLEDRIPPPPDRRAAIAQAAGAIVLGGATQTGPIIGARGGYLLNRKAERLTTVVELRRIRPDLPILVSGGSGSIVSDAPGEGAPEVVARFLDAVGVGRETVDFETRSRNTYENALYSAEAWADRDGPFLLVTSAAHMARSVGAFRQVGLEVIPFPVDYRAPPPSWSWRFIGTRRLEVLRDVTKEYVGLLGYYLAGRTDALFPRP